MWMLIKKKGVAYMNKKMNEDVYSDMTTEMASKRNGIQNAGKGGWIEGQKSIRAGKARKQKLHLENSFQTIGETTEPIPRLLLRDFGRHGSIGGGNGGSSSSSSIGEGVKEGLDSGGELGEASGNEIRCGV
jgi:hypothetical protein